MFNFKLPFFKNKKIDLIRFTGGNIEEIESWLKFKVAKFDDGTFQLQTIDGMVKVNLGDYIIRKGRKQYQVKSYSQIKSEIIKENK